MRNTLTQSLSSYRRELLIALLSTIIFIVYQSSPSVGATINLAILIVIPGVASLGSGPAIMLGYLQQFIPIVLFCTITALAYYLLRVKQPMLTAITSFVAGFLLTTWLALFIQPTLEVRVLIDLAVYFIFLAVLLVFSKRKWHTTIPAIIASIFVLVTLGLTPYVASQIENGRYKAADAHSFQVAAKSLAFTAYYPIYKSVILPASPAKLNGYTKQSYSNETVSFHLAKAEVRESAILTNQDKVMNFTTNCDISAIRFSMETSSSITDSNLQSSLDNFKKCNLIQTTPSGKKVYFASNGQWTNFYVLLNNTNIVITFDDINTQKYDSTQLPEILKIIDSFQPVSVTGLQKGNTSGFGFE